MFLQIKVSRRLSCFYITALSPKIRLFHFFSVCIIAINAIITRLFALVLLPVAERLGRPYPALLERAGVTVGSMNFDPRPF
jgi:hypothetical protein